MPSMPWIVSFECKKVKSLQAKDLCFALFGSRPRHLDLIVIHSSDSGQKGVQMLPMHCRKPSQIELSTTNEFNSRNAHAVAVVPTNPIM